jgi:hypothetical protein
MRLFYITKQYFSQIIHIDKLFHQYEYIIETIIRINE